MTTSTDTHRLFGPDGIRGVANNGTLTAVLALKIGQAAGILFRGRVVGDDRPRVLIGKDTRLSGYMLEPALSAGFTSAGVDVFLTGPMPAPAIAVLTYSMRCDLGVMITASERPYEENGIKLFGRDGRPLSDEEARELEELISTDVSNKLAPSNALGRVKRIDGVQDRYMEYAKGTLPEKNIEFDGLRVVIDCAHGAGYKTAPQVLQELGAEVVKIGVDPDGFNINRECGFNILSVLQRKVHEVRADFGIALDGAAEKAVLVDEKGNRILPDVETTGDDFVAALQMLAAIKKAGRPASQVCRRFEAVPKS